MFYHLRLNSVQRAAFFGAIALLTTTACDSRSEESRTSPTSAQEFTTLAQALSEGVSDLPPGYGFEADSQVPPPRIARPVYHCVQSVFIESCIDNSIIYVFDSDNNLLGKGLCGRSGSATVILDQPLDGEPALYAKQEIDGYLSLTPSEMTPVESYDSNIIHAPRINHDVYECSRLFRADGIVPGATVEISHNTSASWLPSYNVPRQTKHFYALGGSEIAQGEIGNQVQVRQIMCPHDIAATSAWYSADTVKEPATIPTPSPVGASFGIKGSDRFWAQDLLIGAKVSMYNDQVPTLYRTYIAYAQGFLGFNRFFLSREDTVGANWELSASQELCTPSPRSNEFPPAHPETPGVLNPPQIVGPICVGARWVDVDTTTQGAFVTVEKAPNPMSISSDTGRVRMQIPDAYDLNAGDTITSYHVLQDGTKSLPSTETVVITASSLDILGGQDYIDQDSGASITTAFVREKSPGPIFELRECCDGARSDENLTLRIVRADDPSNIITTLDMPKQQNGFYKAQWNLYALADQGALPDPNVTYKAIVTDSCSDPEPEVTFNIVTGEADPNDMIAPVPKSEVSVNGVSKAAEGGGVNATLNARPGHPVNITYSGKDVFGVKKISLLVSGDYSASSRKAHPEQVPLPGQVIDTYSLAGLAPGEQVEVEVTAEDYSGNVSGIAKVVVNAQAAQPEITSVDDDPTWSHDTNGNPNEIDIQGSELWFSGTQTDIEFRNSTTNALIQTISNFAGSQSDELQNVPLPGAVGGMDEVDVIVKVGNTSSPAFVLNLNDRLGPFSKYAGDEFVLFDENHPVNQTYPPYEIPCSNNSSDPHAIQKVVLTPTAFEQNGIPHTANFDVVLNGSPNTVRRVEDNIRIPGVILDEVSCKSIAALGYQSGAIPPGDLTFYHFDDSTTANKVTIANLLGVISVAFSQDGSVGAFTHYAQAGGQSGRAAAYDLTQSSLSNQIIFNNEPTPCNSNCDFVYELNYWREVVIKESGVVQASGVIQ